MPSKYVPSIQGLDLVSEVAIGSPANGLSITANQTLSIALSSGSTTGALSSTDWTTFNGKQSIVTIGALDAQAPNANGAALVANVLSLQSADATHPGLITENTQTIGGQKTFAGNIFANNLAGNNSGDVSIGGANGLSIVGQSLSLGLADSIFSGALYFGDWTTFNNKQPAGNYITALTGDVTATGPGSVAATIASNAVTDAKFRQSAGLSVVGRSANSTGNVADITAASDNQIMRRSGTSIAFGSIDISQSAAVGSSVLAIANGGTGQTSASTAFTALSPLTTKGDLLAYSTTNVRVAVGADGTFLKADSGATPGVSWASPNGILTYRSVTTTDTCTNADDTLVLSGASFTENLFTAVGNTGKVLTIVHNGTSLSQVYTIDPNGGQTINGFGSSQSTYILYTQGEVLRIQSDGANWTIIGRYSDTPWAVYTPTFTGFGTITVQSFRWKRTGNTLYIKGRWTSATPTAVEARVSFPASAPNSASDYGTTEITGALGIGDNTATIFYPLMEASVAYITFGRQDATHNALTKMNGNNLPGTTTVVSVDCSVAVATWNP